MTKAKSGAWTLERLDRLVAAYGGNARRWPDTDRDGLAVFLAGSPEARRRMAEATALDALLDSGAAVETKADTRLLERIVAAAAAERGSAIEARVVVPFRPRPMVQARRATGWNVRWREASLLAATLLVGLYIGAAGIADRVFTGDGDNEFESALVVLPNDVTDAVEEETL